MRKLNLEKDNIVEFFGYEKKDADQMMDDMENDKRLGALVALAKYATDDNPFNDRISLALLMSISAVKGKVRISAWDLVTYYNDAVESDEVLEGFVAELIEQTPSGMKVVELAMKQK